MGGFSGGARPSTASKSNYNAIHLADYRNSGLSVGALLSEIKRTAQHQIQGESLATRPYVGQHIFAHPKKTFGRLRGVHFITS